MLLRAAAEAAPPGTSIEIESLRRLRQGPQSEMLAPVNLFARERDSFQGQLLNADDHPRKLLDSTAVSRPARDLKGRTFRRLTVIKRAPNSGRHSAWVCRCTCGEIRVVRANNLLTANTVSCGCWNREAIKNRGAALHARRKRSRSAK
jgi:hypothetical protein